MSNDVAGPKGSVMGDRLGIAVNRALFDPACQRLNEWALIGPVQRAALESFAERLLAAERARVAELEAALAARQAEIDRLMLEHCPDEMSSEQKAQWAAHQVPFDPEAVLAMLARGQTVPERDAQRARRWAMDNGTPISGGEHE